MKLVEPDKKLKQAFQVMIEDFKTNDPKHYGQYYAEYGDDFDLFLEKVANEKKAIGDWPDMVPGITYWLMDDDETVVLAESNLRLGYTKQLLSGRGGNIGYRVPPSQRQKGYGKETLRLTLEKAKEHKFYKILVTCDVNNLGSNKIIQANGGVLENTVPIPETGQMGNRYWIEI